MAALTTFRFCLLLALLEIGYSIYSDFRPRPHQEEGYLVGDCPYYAWTTVSLARDGDWDLGNQMPGDLKEHEGFFALSANGRIVPKHSPLLPIVSIPFYLLVGYKGFLIVNLLLMFALLFGILLLAGGGIGARWLVVAGYLSTPFLAYTYNYSPDVLGACLVVWSFVFAIRRRPILAGLFAGLAIWAKIYLVVVLLPVALLIIPLGWRKTAACGVAAFIAVAPILLINNHLFGSPIITGYDRDARILPNGGFTITEHYSRFNQPFLTGLGNLLFNREIGMLFTAPLWFLWPIGLALILFHRRCSRDAEALRSGALRPPCLPAIAMALAILFNLIVFAKYDEWNASLFGNRFLFPALALGLALQGPLWMRLLNERSSASVPAT